MPPTPTEARLQNTKRVLFDGLPDPKGGSASCELPKPAKFYSQPIQTTHQQEMNTQNLPNVRRLIDRRFDSFKTWSGKLERQITNLRGKAPIETRPEDVVLKNSDIEPLTVDRYYDALEGPELETLKVILPDYLSSYMLSHFHVLIDVLLIVFW